MLTLEIAVSSASKRKQVYPFAWTNHPPLTYVFAERGWIGWVSCPLLFPISKKALTAEAESRCESEPLGPISSCHIFVTSGKRPVDRPLRSWRISDRLHNDLLSQRDAVNCSPSLYTNPRCLYPSCCVRIFYREVREGQTFMLAFKTPSMSSSWLCLEPISPETK